MAQTPEAQAFISRIVALPPGTVSLDAALQPSLDDEAALRRLYAQDKTNARLVDPHVGLVDVFAAPTDIRVTRARAPKDEAELYAKYVVPLSEKRRRAEGAPAIVGDMDAFRKSWAIFTEGSLSQLADWSGVVAAGGSVLACMTPLPGHALESKRAMRKWFHNIAYPSSDVDLFLYGMTPEQAECKIVEIYEAVRDSVPWDVTCVRTKHAVSIHSQYPYRSVQIVLRLYSSLAEIMAGFDIDACCACYDGDRVWANPRQIVAMMRQCNTVDMTRRSPSYEVRLAKYAVRDSEVYVPNLRREDIDPTIFERAINRIEGLARLLVLEKLADPDARQSYIDARRDLRGRPDIQRRWQDVTRRRYKGDMKADLLEAGLQVNDYDVAVLHIPYGPNWDARRIEKLVYQTDLGMNSPFNPKNKDRRLHRHPAFFGTMDECLADCCEHCPEPKDDDEKKQLEDYNKAYIKGRVQFIREDPGRQSMSASFNPIDVSDWSELSYVGKTEKFFAAIATSDCATVAQMLQEGTDVNRRDHVGRTALHLAILCGATKIACILVDAGARMTARVVDGRSSLHLAAQFGRTEIAQKMLERSKANAEKAEKDMAVKPNVDEDATMSDAGDEDEDEEMRDSSEDDWSSEGSSERSSEGSSEGSECEDKPKKKKNADGAQNMPSVGQGDIPEDAMDEPDIFEINAPDWDLGFTALGHAVVSGSVAIVDALLSAGADATLSTKAQREDATELHPLTLTLFLRDETCADALVQRLVAAGAAASTADGAMMTIFHRAVAADKVAVARALLRGDPKAASVVNLPAMAIGVVFPPTMSAVDKGGYAILALLLAYGGKITLSEEDVASAIELSVNPAKRLCTDRYPYNAVLPVETAIRQRDHVLHLLLSLGADVNVPVRQAVSNNKDTSLSLLDYTRCAITALRKALDPPPPPEAVRPADLDGWKSFVMEKAWRVNDGLRAFWKEKGNNLRVSIEEIQATLDWLVEVEAALCAAGAKTWNEIFPDNQLTEQDQPGRRLLASLQPNNGNNNNLQCQSIYGRMNDGWPLQELVPKHQVVQYDELFAACWQGDHDTIRNLCLPGDVALDGRAALQITVIHNSFVGDDENLSNTIGYNPLWIAVMAGKWETARLILAIAAAQYKTPDAKPAQYSTKDISLEEDDEGNSDDDSEMSDDTVDQVNFRDLATRPSAVQCNIKPEKLLKVAARWPFTKDGKETYGPVSLLGKTIVDGDLQTFIKVADLYDMLPDTTLDSVLPLIMQHDCPEILDEYIRRTGVGLQLKEDIVQDAHEQSADDNPGKNEYWGLNVHGKKRKDLAKKGDPSAGRTPLHAREKQLVFSAAENGALSIMEYLASERPEKAYRHWGATSSETRAVRLRQLSEADIKARMPGWLGWEVNGIGESALTTAIVSGKIDSVKKLFELSPKLMKDALNARMMLTGYNSVLLAAATLNSNAAGMIDVLLDYGVSAEATDKYGWNIFHLLSGGGAVDVLKHIMSKFSDETCLELANKQPKGHWDTPLHRAVRRRHTACMELLLSKDPQGYALARRDENGSTALHVAVQNAHPGTVRLLLDACAAADPGLLHLENAVGETPLETALQRYLVECAARPHWNDLVPAALDQYYPVAPSMIGVVGKLPSRLDRRRLEKDVPRLREMLDALGQEGRLIKGSELSNKLEEFWDRTRKALEASLQRTEQLVVRDREEDRAQTLDLVQSAVSANRVGRGLVRLDEVQRLVRAKVDRHGEGRGLGDVREKNAKALAKGGDGLGEE